MEVHPMEKELLEKIRNNYRFGEVVIECRDGLPVRLGKTTVYEALYKNQK